MATSSWSWDLATSRQEHEFALLERRAVHGATCLGHGGKAAVRGAGKASNLDGENRVCEKLEWPRKELKRQLLTSERPRM